MRIQTIFLFFLLFTAGSTFSQFEDVNLKMDGNWHSLKSEDGINVSYKFQVCEQFDRQVAKYLLKVTNTNLETKHVRFSTETYLNGDCTNCNRIDDQEYLTSIFLDENSTVEGVCGQNKKQLELFSHFIIHVPGMSGKHLTDIKIVNLDID